MTLQDINRVFISNADSIRYRFLYAKPPGCRIRANIFNTFGGFSKAGQKNFILHSLFGAPALYLKHVRRLKRFTARLFIVVIGVRCNFAQLAIVPGL